MSFASASRSFEMAGPTGAGRTFTARRRVRLGDATPKGRLRLDAVARYLQDVSNDDTRDAEWSDPHWWVVRRTVIDVLAFPEYLQEIDLTTWCGGTGSHWAERRTRITSLGGDVLVDAAALWVHVDRDNLQPSRVPADVAGILAESSAGRTVGARLLLREKDFDAAAATVSPWPLRFSDFDAVGHMNNAAYWEVLEEHMTGDVTVRSGLRAVVEHVVQVEPGQSLMRASVTGDGVSVQMTVGGTVHAAAWAGPSA
jgi:acyl-ACP thioesterase